MKRASEKNEAGLQGTTALVVLSAWLAMLLVASPGASQQVVHNPGFDTGIDGWFAFGLDDGSVVEWTEEDAHRDPLSGAMYVVNQQPHGLCSGLGQRGLPVTAEEDYRYGGWVRIPADPTGDPPYPHAHFEVQFYFAFQSGFCTGFLGKSFIVIESTAQAWTRFSKTVATPPYTVCANFLVGNCQMNVGPAVESFADSVFLLGPSIFADGFESGDTSAWSVTEE